MLYSPELVSAIHQHESALVSMCPLPLEPPPTSHPISPLCVVTEPWLEFPESYRKFSLAIYFTYGNVCFPGLPGGSEVKASACVCLQCGRPEFDSWVGKIPWKRMETHSSTLAWRIPWTEEPGGLQSPGLQRVRHD